MKALIKKLNFGANIAVFALFFGLATLEAIQTQNWLKALFFLAIGIVFVAADNRKQRA